MAWVERLVTRTTQPQDACGIDPNQGASFVMCAGQGLRDLVSGASAVTGAGLVIRPTTKGLSVDTSGVSGYQMYYPNSRPLDGSAAITVEFLIIPTTLGGKPVAQWQGTNNTWLTQVDADGSIIVGVGTGQAGAVDARKTPPGVAVINKPCHFFWTWSGGDVNNNSVAYVNGVIVSSKGTWASVFTSGTFNTIQNSEFTPIAISGSSESGSGFNGGVILAKTYRRVLSHFEIKHRTQNPYFDFDPEIESTWVPDYVSTGGVFPVQSDANLNYVLQANTLNSQGGLYSILGLVNSSINSSYKINEARVNSSSASYVVRNSVSASKNEEYKVLAALSSTQGSTYNVRSALSKDQGSTYFISESTYKEQLVDYVIRSSQQRDQSATYSILSANSVGNNASLNYVISALIQQDQQENYLVRSSSHQETSGIYTVRTSAENSTEGSYAVRGSLNSESQLNYSIRAEVNSSGTLSYTIRASLVKDQGLLYEILAANSVLSSSSGSYVIQATTANNTTCSYQIQGEVIDLPLTNAEMQQLYAWVSELVNKSATKEEIATATWSKPQSEMTVENSIGKWLMQKVLTVSKFLALK